MNIYLNLILLLFGYVSYAQSCDTLGRKVINCIDSNGNRQGYWEVKRCSNSISSWSLGPNGCTYSEKCIGYRQVGSGNYINGRKLDTWKYYKSKDDSTFVEKKVTYYKDGSIKEENLQNKYVIEVNQDSSILTGLYYKEDTILFECSNSICKFNLLNGFTIVEFPFDEFLRFDFEFYRLKIGVYRREIKMNITH